ncbi:DNA polymerase III subunit alpha [Candidatus Fermentibacterales bacterium]|nr:DNA polymerase III subunit alpha [Candidatus Fermentibacterales bacterium]
MTARPDFVHLHLHSEYSLLDGAIRFCRLGEAVRDMGMKAVAVTDHGSLCGAIDFCRTMSEAGVKPIVGMEAYLTTGSRHDRSYRPGSRPYFHLTLLAENMEGYRNLCRLSSLGYLEGFYYKPRIDRECLERYSSGLFIGSACLQGEVAQSLLVEDAESARSTVRYYQDLVGHDRFFIELMDHGLEDERRILPALADLARSTGAILAATNDAHYLHRSDSRSHEVLLCLQTQKKLEDADRMRFGSDEFFVKDPMEMANLFGWVPESLTNTVHIAERCGLELEQSGPLLPDFPLPEGEGSAGAFLERNALEGLSERLGRQPDAPERQRLESELAVIREMGFPGYFLIVSELRSWARSRGIPMGPGRGSAAGSLVSYATGITDINPLEHGLSFERFLNRSRRELPDIDLDVCYERRGEVIDHIIQLYGRESVCQIITFNRMKARMAIRDTARVMGLSYEEGDELARMVARSQSPDPSMSELMDEVPELRTRAEADPRVAELLRHCEVLENIARNSSVHAAGVIIAPGDLMDYVPLATTGSGEITTQYEKKAVETIGLLKLDVLGLRTVTVISQAVGMLHARGVELEIEDIPLDDAATLALLSRGETVGVFQLESPGMREALRRIAVSEFDDITAVVAIYRPGSMDMLDLYVRNKHGDGVPRDDLRTRHPVLGEILEETYGVMIYQEQVMEIGSRFAGMSLADADVLRRAMSRKIREVMLEQRARFIEGAVANGVSAGLASTVFELVEKFAGYGFNKSHAVSYAMLAYQTAYLKAHFAPEFMAATMSSEIGRIDRLSELVEECRRLRVRVLKPSVNESETRFTVDDEGSIVYALSAIKNVGEAPSDATVAARSEDGPFRDIFELCARLDGRCLNRKGLQSLVEAGALDCLPGTRGQLLAVLDEAVDYGARIRQLREAGQMSLFSAGGASALPVAPELPDVEDLSEESRLSSEKALLGFYLSGHPLDQYIEELRSLSVQGAPGGGPGKKVSIGGVIVDRKDTSSRKGDPICFVTLDGRGYTLEAVAFSEQISQYDDLLQPGSFVMLEGEMSRRRNNRSGGESGLVIGRVIELSECRRVLNAGLHLLLEDGQYDIGDLERAVDLMRGNPGRGAVTAQITGRSGRTLKVRSRSIRIDPSDRLLSGLREILGRDRVVLRRGRDTG